jgi:hypothetical protein
MGQINLLTGTASGKIGQFQFQTHGMKCVVRTRQPQGLTNDQAELINKPILLDLSASYHQWARHLLTVYPSDWAKPQALWNYYTKCNRPVFEGTAQYVAGFSVVLHGAVKQYQASYTLDSGTSTAVFSFDENPAALPASTVVCLVRGLTSGPPEQWEISTFPVSASPQPAPYWNEEAGSENIGFFLLDYAGKLYGGMTQCSIHGVTPPEYFSPTPADIAANMLIFEELTGIPDNLQIRFAFNTAFMPPWIAGKTVRYTTHTALEGHPAGTSWTAPYSPSATFRLQHFEAVSPLDPLLTWVILDGAEEKSDHIALRVTNIVIPSGCFENLSIGVFQEVYYGSNYYAQIEWSTNTPESEHFLLNLYLKITGQGSMVPFMPSNPMCEPADGFPYLWEDRPRVPVTLPCGTAQFVLGDHPGDSAYFIGPSFALDYREE